MIYIFEGNECCFKSTTANKLSDLIGFPVIKGSSFELSQCSNEELYFYFKKILDMDDIIVDRFIYSNLVYASLYDDYSILNEDQVDDIQQVMNKKKLVTVYLTADDETIKERLRIRGDDYVVEDMVSNINEKYREVMQNAVTQVNINTYDTRLITSNQIAEELAAYIK